MDDIDEALDEIGDLPTNLLDAENDLNERILDVPESLEQHVEEEHVPLVHPDAPVRKKKKQSKWIQETDHHGNTYFVHHKTRQRKPINSDMKNILQVPIPAPIAPLSDQDEIAYCLLDIIDSIITIDKQVKQEHKRLKKKHRLNAYYDASKDLAVFEGHLLSIVPQALPHVNLHLRRRQKLRMQRKRYRHMEFQKEKIDQLNAKRKAELLADSAKKRKDRMEALDMDSEDFCWELEMEIECLKRRFRRRHLQEKHKANRKILTRKRQKQNKIKGALTVRMMQSIQESATMDISKVDFSDPRQAPGYVMSKDEYWELNQQLDAEKEQDRRNELIAQKIFICVDPEAKGKIPVDHLIKSLLFNSVIQTFCAWSPPLKYLKDNDKVQEDLKNMTADENHLLTIDDFVLFVQTVAQVLKDGDRIEKRLMELKKQAEREELEAWENTFNKKETVLVNSRKSRQTNVQTAALGKRRTTLAQNIMQRHQSLGIPKGAGNHTAEEVELSWESHHYHRYIRLAPSAPLYCCICRRRKWEFQKLQRDVEEEIYQKQWISSLPKRLRDREGPLQKEIENEIELAKQKLSKVKQTAYLETLRQLDHGSRQQNNNNNNNNCEKPAPKRKWFSWFKSKPRKNLLPISAHSSSTEQEVWNLLQEMVATVVNAEHQKYQRSVQKVKTKTNNGRRNAVRARRKSNVFDLVSEALCVLKEKWQKQEMERSEMYLEEERVFQRQEFIRRLVERKERQIQELGHRNYLQLLSNCRRPSPNFTRLQWERTLVSGEENMVVLVRDESEGMRCVVHVLVCESVERATELRREISKLKLLVHPNLHRPLHVFQHVLLGFSSRGDLTKHTNVVIVVTEYCAHGSLQDVLNQRGSILKQWKACDIFYMMGQVTGALANLHRQGIFHGNIKANNIYVSRNGNLQLGGFFWMKDTRDVRLLTDTCSGGLSDCIRPPEMLRSNQQITLKADVWALGCLGYHLMQGKPCQLNQVSLDRILTALPLRFGKPCYSLLRMCLQMEAELRAPAQQVFDYISLEMEAPSADRLDLSYLSIGDSMVKIKPKVKKRRTSFLMTQQQESHDLTIVTIVEEE